jgi:signal peptidase II
MRTFLTGLVTFGTCSAARWYLDREDREDKDFVGGHVKLTKLWNEGAAFNLKISRNVILSISGAVLATLWLTRRRSPLGAGLALGGGLSNLVERLKQGKVYDYVRFPKAPGKLKKYVFNLADFAIMAGAMLCVIASE